MSCVLNFVFLAIVCRKVLAQPNISAPVDSIVEMGRGLEHVPSGAPQIKTLNLAYNHIAVLPENVFQNRSYRTLTKIELYQNKIHSIHLSAFRGLRQLTMVDLSDNNISTIDPYTFRHNPKLEKLDLSGNKILFSRLQVFLVAQHLESLVLSRNRIEQVHQLTFMGLPALKNLILSHNVLFMMSPNSFRHLEQLQYLCLANTGVYRLTESMFHTNLPRIIDLQETPLAKRFDPPLKKVTNAAVRSLLTIDQYIFISDTAV